MAMPRLIARLNKRFLNQKELAKGVRPILTHVGRINRQRSIKRRSTLTRSKHGYVFFPDLRIGL